MLKELKEIKTHSGRDLPANEEFQQIYLRLEV